VRYAAKVDRIQNEVVEALRRAGVSVQPLHTVGKGCPDLLVGIRGVNLVLEVKDGELPPSRRTLTPEQVRWHADWRGQVAVVESIEAALDAVFGPAA
jgi:Holliday junction resolvase